MEKHGYTPLQQAVLLAQQLDTLEEMVINARHAAENVETKLMSNPVPDYGAIAIPGMSDIVGIVNRASNTATCLQTLVMLAAIENNQL